MSNSSLSFYLIILLAIQTSFAYYFDGYEIRDLYGTTFATFESDANLWSANILEPGSPIYYICGSLIVVGGVGVLGSSYHTNYNMYGSQYYQAGNYFERKYTAISAHSSVIFSFELWQFYTLDAGDYFNVRIDGSVIMTSWQISATNFVSTLCGVSVMQAKIFGRAPHTSNSLTLRFTSYLDEGSNNEAFGFREINLIFSKSTVSGPTWCQVSPITLSTPCSCPDGQYYSGTCKNCDPACVTCFDAGPANCYQCAIYHYYDGSKCDPCYSTCATCSGPQSDQCLSCKSGYILNEAAECMSTSLCTSPLVTRTLSGGQPMCVTPCPVNVFLYWNDTCINHCHHPLRTNMAQTYFGNIFTCEYPCTTSQFLYWDGLCENTCPSLILTTDLILYYNRKACHFHCNSAPNTIVYWDGTCNSTCPFPLYYYVEHQRAFCDFPCATNEYLYTNGSCLPTCQQYFVNSPFKGKRFCYYPCSSSQYLYSNGSCLGTCAYPFYNLTMGSEKYCYYPCLKTHWLYNNDSCISTCDWRFDRRILVGEQYCDYPCPIGQFLYFNRSCLDYCRPYFNTWFDSTSKTRDWYCDHPCNNSFLLNNGTCRSTCDSRYISYNDGNDKMCNYPCKPSEYLYRNGSCLQDCGPYFIPSTYQGDNFCDYPCSLSHFLYYNGSCLSACNPPYKPWNVGSEKFCGSPCKTNDFLYDNNTCYSYCPDNFIKRYHGSDAQCIFPCASGQYLYQNGTCASGCTTHFLSKTFGTHRYCYFPCAADDFLHKNGSCLSNCHPLFPQLILGTERYCNYPCASNEFVYWNKTCLSSCQPPLIQKMEDVQKLCIYPCKAHEFLYWNVTCSNECKFPLLSKIESGLNYCTYPCSNTQFLSWDGSCIESCQFPFKIKNQGLGALCSLPCDRPDDFYYEETGECKQYCDMTKQVVNNLFYKCIPSTPSEGTIMNFLSTPPIEAGTVTLISLAKPIQYLRFISARLSPRLERLNKGKGITPVTLNFGHIIHHNIVPEQRGHFLPYVFEKYNMPTAFLINLWPMIMSMTILFALIAFFTTFELIFKKAGWTEWQHIFERLRVIVRWNMPIMLITTNMGDIIIYSFLEFQSLNLRTTLGRGSLTICIFVLLSSVLILICGGLAASKAFVTRKTAIHTKSFSSYASFLTNWQGLQVLFRGFRDDKLINSYFYLIYVARVAIPNIIAATLYISPLLQATFYSGISIVFILFLFEYKPIKKHVNHVQLLMFEFLLFIVNGCVLTLAIFDKLETDNINTRIFLSDVIIICNFVINIFPIAFFVIKFALIVRAAINLQKRRPKDSKAIWLQLFFLPIQQAGFGFEQVQILRFSDGYTRLASQSFSINMKKQILNQGSLPNKSYSSQRSVVMNENRSLRSSFQMDEVIDLQDSFPINKVARKDKKVYS